MSISYVCISVMIFFISVIHSFITYHHTHIKVMIAEAMDIERETYLAIVMDRESGGPMVVCSPCGGVDIEEVAHNQPEKIFKVGAVIDQCL